MRFFFTKWKLNLALLLKKETKIILWASPCRAWKLKLKWKWIYTTTSYCTKSTNCNCHMKVLLLLSPPTSLGCPYHLSYLFKKFLQPACFKKVIYNNTFTIIIRHIFDSCFINSLFFVRSYIISFRPLILLQSGHPRSWHQSILNNHTEILRLVFPIHWFCVAVI